MDTEQLVGFLCVIAVLLVVGFFYYLGIRRYSRLQKRVEEERKEWDRFTAETVLCDKCLGTGRAPKEGRVWPAEAIERFNKRAEIEKIPQQFRDAFKG